MAAWEREEIRTATAHDATEVARLLRAFNAEYDEPAPPVRRLAARIGRLLAEGKIVALLAGEAPATGVAVLRLRPALWSEAEDAYLEELYVIPGQRGRGIGRRLLEAAMDAARSAGASHFELSTAEADTEARSLYESSGLTNFEGGAGGPRMLYYEREL